MYEGDVHGAGLVDGHRPHPRPRSDDHRQRSDDQGRRLLSDDGQEAPARAGDRGGEPSPLRLSGRFRRRQSAPSGRSLSRPRAFRPHLLQSGAHVGGGHRADRGRHGLLHRGRRLCPGDVGRDDHRREAGDDLSRRPAAGEGGDRRDGQRRGSRRRRSAHPRLGRRRHAGARRRACARARAPRGRQSQPAAEARRSNG